MTTIGQQLRLARTKLGLSGIEAAEKTGLSPKLLLEWERDEKLPPVTNIVKLCKLYNCSITITGDNNG